MIVYFLQFPVSNVYFLHKVVVISINMEKEKGGICMTWIIAIVSFFLILILSEEMIYYLLRTKVMENPPKRERNEGKMKVWIYKIKLKLNHPQ
jgi:hypothetical protein